MLTLASWLLEDLSAAERIAQALTFPVELQGQLVTLCMGAGYPATAQALLDKGVLTQPLTHVPWRWDLRTWTEGLPGHDPWDAWALWARLHPAMASRLNGRAGHEPSRAPLIASFSKHLPPPQTQGRHHPVALSLRRAATEPNQENIQERWAFEEACVSLSSPEPGRSAWLRAALPRGPTLTEDSWIDWRRVRAWGVTPDGGTWQSAQREDHRHDKGTVVMGPRQRRLLEEEGAIPVEARDALLLAAVTKGRAAEVSNIWGKGWEPDPENTWLLDVIKADEHEKTWACLPGLEGLGRHAQAVDSQGQSALHVAVRQLHFPAVQTLLHWGADPWAVDGKERYAWEGVTRRALGRLQHWPCIVEALSQALGQPAVRWPGEQVPLLHTSAQLLDLVTMKHLLDTGMSANVRSASGEQPLDALVRQHLHPQASTAHRKELVACATLLIESGARLHHGHLAWATSHLFTGLLEYMLQRVEVASLPAMGITGTRWRRAWKELSGEVHKASPTTHALSQDLAACVRLWEHHKPSDDPWNAWKGYARWPAVKAALDAAILRQALSSEPAPPPSRRL